MHQVSVEKFKHFYEETWTQPQGFAGVEVQGEDGLQVRLRLPLGASPPPFGCFLPSRWVRIPPPLHPPRPAGDRLPRVDAVGECQGERPGPLAGERRQRPAAVLELQVAVRLVAAARRLRLLPRLPRDEEAADGARERPRAPRVRVHPDDVPARGLPVGTRRVCPSSPPRLSSTPRSPALTLGRPCSRRPLLYTPPPSPPGASRSRRCLCAARRAL